MSYFSTNWMHFGISVLVSLQIKVLFLEIIIRFRENLLIKVQKNTSFLDQISQKIKSSKLYDTKIQFTSSLTNERSKIKHRARNVT